MQKLVAVSSLIVVSVSLAAMALAAGTALDPQTLLQARKVKADLSARYSLPGGPKLRVSEASSTGIIESYALVIRDQLRYVPADNGIFYAVCPVRAKCPFPGLRAARPPAAFNPRRLALELAVRTFRETSADLVVVSLPTDLWFTLFIVERGELAQAADTGALATALSGNPVRAPAAALRTMVDDLTRPRIFVALGLEPSPNGRESLGAAALWPDATPTGRR
jgi:hypothetical protein